MSITDLRIKVRKLRIGRSMLVGSEYERQSVLRSAKELGLRLATRKLLKGGFTVTRLPNDN